MNKVLFMRILNKQLVVLVSYSVVLFLFQYLIVWLFPSMGGLGGSMAEMIQELPPAFRSMMGGQHLLFASIVEFVSIGFVHPLPLLIFAAYPISLAISSVAGEISMRTGELLFTKPLRRYKVIGSYYFVMLLGSMVISILSILGVKVGLIAIDESIGTIYLIRLAINTIALIIAIGGMSFLVSSSIKHGSKAGSIAGGITAFMYVFNFLADLWDSIEPARVLMIFNYYRPADVLQGQEIWINHTLILFITGIVLTLISMFILEKRDL